MHKSSPFKRLFGRLKPNTHLFQTVYRRSLFFPFLFFFTNQKTAGTFCRCPYHKYPCSLPMNPYENDGLPTWGGRRSSPAAVQNTYFHHITIIYFISAPTCPPLTEPQTHRRGGQDSRVERWMERGSKKSTSPETESPMPTVAHLLDGGEPHHTNSRLASNTTHHLSFLAKQGWHGGGRFLLKDKGKQ